MVSFLLKTKKQMQRKMEIETKTDTGKTDIKMLPMVVSA